MGVAPNHAWTETDLLAALDSVFRLPPDLRILWRWRWRWRWRRCRNGHRTAYHATTSHCDHRAVRQRHYCKCRRVDDAHMEFHQCEHLHGQRRMVGDTAGRRESVRRSIELDIDL
jgi:hypothetical protein